MVGFLAVPPIRHPWLSGCSRLPVPSLLPTKVRSHRAPCVSGMLNLRGVSNLRIDVSGWLGASSGSLFGILGLGVDDHLSGPDRHDQGTPRPQ